MVMHGVNFSISQRHFKNQLILCRLRYREQNGAVCCGTSAWRWAIPATPPPCPHLQKAAKDSEPLIAEHARWAVERIQGKKLL
jgi:epoxyqueuosine reductase QueG